MFNKLCKAAAHHKLPKLQQEGKPEEMREVTNTWIEGIQDVLCTNKRKNGILDDYPNVPTDLPPLVNDALGSFLRAKISHQIKSMLSDIDMKDGIGILKEFNPLMHLCHLKTEDEL